MGQILGGIIYLTDKRKDAWSQDFISILGCGLWSGLNCETKGLGPFMSKFWDPFFHFFGVKIFFVVVWKHYSVRTETCIYTFFMKKKQFDPEKVKKKRASKIAHNRPRPFYFTVQPRPQPTAQNWFYILWNLGTRHLFSYLRFYIVNLEYN